jgi:gentisate 1,2-dioxygenase
MLHPYSQAAQAIDISSEQVGAWYGPVKPQLGPPADYFHYRWRDTYPLLEAVAASGQADPHDGYRLEYRNPKTGGPTMPTIQCSLQLLRPGQETRAHRHTSTVIYHAFRGSGTTEVGDQALDWEEGDVFVVPLWHPHRHHNRSSSADAILFSMSDAPVLEALELHRIEAVD